MCEKKDNTPIVLVISSSFFSTTSNNGKTLSSIFYGYPKEKIVQLSFSVAPNDGRICEHYYAITNNDILRFRKGREYGVITRRTIEDNVSLKHNRFHKMSIKRAPLTVFLKNLGWRFIRFEGIDLFIEKYKPDIVFFQGFSMSYGYRIALRICRKYDLPMILELTDDYTEHLYPHSVLDRINHSIYDLLFERAICYSSSILVISPKMKTEYEKRYHKKMIEMMNSVDFDEKLENQRDEKEFVYAGNLHLNRWRVLISLSVALESLDPDYRLYICTPDYLDKDVEYAFSKRSNIIYGGILSSYELKQKLRTAKYVVHVESFDTFNNKITQYSLSTKIPEYMSSGALIIAIGPPFLSSIEYIKNEAIGVTITDSSITSITNALKSISDGHINEHQLIYNAFKKCKENHSKEKNSRVLRELIIEASKDNIP